MNLKTYYILDALNKNRNGLTISLLFNSLEEIYDDVRALHSFVSLLVRRGFIKTDGALECSHCFEKATCYRITEKGRIHLEYLR